MRLIDADALMDVIREHEYRLATKQGSIDYGMFTLGIQQAVDEQPTIDAEPVKRGRWGTNSDRPDSLICSVCKCGFDMWKHDPHNYCPNCGAYMRGEEE